MTSNGPQHEPSPSETVPRPHGSSPSSDMPQSERSSSNPSGSPSSSSNPTPADASRQGASGEAQDLASLRREVESLRRDARRYRSLVDLTTDAAYDLERPADEKTPAYRLTWASASFARMLAVSHGQLLADGDWIDYVHPADRTLFDRHRAHLAQGSRMVTEYRIRTGGEAERWVCDYGQPVHGSGGVVRVHGALREITHERRYDKAVRANRIKYKHIFNNSPLGIFHFDAEGCLTQCNDNFVEIVGSSRAQLIGLNMVEDLHDEDMVRAVSEALHNGSGAYEGDYASVTANKVTPVRVLFNSIQSEDGRVVGGVGIVEDITERRRYERELIRARDEAEAMNQLKSAFLANMSHEIRTPLTAIIGFADILTEELPSTHRRIPKLIEQSGKRLLDTLNSVLDLSMLESGEMEMSLTTIDVTQHVEEHVHLMRPLADNKNLTLRMERDEAPLYARLDEGALDRILSNLIGNAIKFTDEGEVTVTVQAAPFPPPPNESLPVDVTSSGEPRRGAEPSPGVEITVMDTGVGISDDFLPQLFDVFKQESAGLQRTHEGSGLGLAITRHLVDHLDGQIRVRTRKDEGSTFSVHFAATETPPDAPPSTRSTLPRHQPGCRILVVEDTHETQVLIDRILSPHHEVDVVGSADAALEAARRDRPLGTPPYDVVLLDINLDGTTSGLDLLPELRAMPNFAQTPIIAITAFAMSGDREHFLDAGFDAYLGKPFTSNQLLDVVDRAIGEEN